ncbi:MAG: fatty acid desaturase [Alphaproteobacteria bacterium]|nr:fatty acid desaturase [Alphaproteobacteria bacterium]
MMSGRVLTPITQALEAGILTRRELKQLMRRSNAPAFLHLAGIVGLILVTSGLIHLSYETWWIVPAMFLQGVLLVHLFAPQHETVHYTLFRTRWLNDVMGTLFGFIIMLPHQHFRYEHCDHHTFTQLPGRDPELIPLPATLAGYFYYISSIPYWRNKGTELFRHICGRLSKEEKRFLPVSVRPVIFWEARAMALAYAAIIGFCFYADWWAPAFYWWLPVLLGEPVMRAVRLTEHVGRPTIRDMGQNTRTNLVSWPLRFLCWNMNYHAEHHYAASVPYHALPALHRRITGLVYVEPRGYWGAHVDIIRQLIGTSPRQDRVIKEAA